MEYTVDDFSKLIKKERKRRKWTQNVLAEKVGVAYHTIQHYEYNHHFPSLDMADGMLRLLGYEIVIREIEK